MPVLFLVAAYGVVHAVAVYLIRASGVYVDLFGRDWSRLHAGDGSEVLAAASGEWIDNHAFWQLSDGPRPRDRFWDDDTGRDDTERDDTERDDAERDDADVTPLRAVNS